ncbi:MAG: DUF1800 domain-containing protein [Rhodospirillales bacterium]|nr:DUF1800 domain-containing protein [Rhodospirillales bacterium]
MFAGQNTIAGRRTGARRGRAGWGFPVLGPAAVASLALVLALGWPAHALTFDEARHLLSRTGFGAPSVDSVTALMPLDHTAAVDRLLGGLRREPMTPPPPWVGERPPPPAAWAALSAAEQRALRARRRERGRDLREWWLGEMLETTSPLTERLVLFWHNHLPSSLRQVKWPAYIYRQNATFRRHAAGNFADLLRQVAKQPAMLLYLDGQTNRAGNPNENFAREFLELFTFGEGRGYTEGDIREAARAFTGWRIDPESGGFTFASDLHDGGIKTFMGRRGRFTGDDIIDIVLDEPRVAKHITEKLWRVFVSPSPAPTEVDRLATQFRRSSHVLGPLLRGLLNSPQFRAAANRGVLVKSPIDLSVGTLRLLQLRSDDRGWLASFNRRLGQDVLDPPNVRGWPGGTTWITSATLPARHAFLLDVWQSAEKTAIAPAGRLAPLLLPLPAAVPVIAGEGPHARQRRLLLDPAFQLK